MDATLGEPEDVMSDGKEVASKTRMLVDKINVLVQLILGMGSLAIAVFLWSQKMPFWTTATVVIGVIGLSAGVVGFIQVFITPTNPKKTS